MASQRVYKAEGIVLKRKNVGEADRIITIFTKEHGKVRVIARGVRKVSSRRASHLEVFTHISVVVHSGKTMDSLSEVQTISTLEHVRGDLKRVSLAYYISELVDSLLAEKQEHRDVFAMLLKTLDELNNPQVQDIYRKTKIFTSELLWVLGFLPKNKQLAAGDLQSFIESITERRLKSPNFARKVMH